MTPKIILPFVALCLFSQISQAARVLKLGNGGNGVLLSQNNPNFKEGDRICLYGEGKNKPHACGDVVKSNATAAIVKITKSTAPASLGDVARFSAKARGTASVSSSRTSTSRGGKSKQFALGIGPLGNWNFFIGSIHAQFAPSPNIAFGLLPFYVSSGSENKVTDFGSFLTFNYYMGGKPFSGLWIAAGAGFHKLHLEGPDDVIPGVTVTEDATALSLLGTVGYRHHFNEMFQAGFSAGPLYTKESTTIFTLSFNGVVPIFLADVGIVF